jgi:ABC-2 type transport system ATP-binding protein
MLTAERGRTVVLCTHFLAEAGRLADQMAILHKGRLVTSGVPRELAARMWPGLEFAIDLGRPLVPHLLAEVTGLPGVLGTQATTDGALVTVEERRQIAAVVSHLVSGGVDVFGATPRPKTLEDVYFAYEDTLGEDTERLTEALR